MLEHRNIIEPWCMLKLSKFNAHSADERILMRQHRVCKAVVWLKFAHWLQLFWVPCDSHDVIFEDDAGVCLLAAVQST